MVLAKLCLAKVGIARPGDGGSGDGRPGGGQSGRIEGFVGEGERRKHRTDLDWPGLTGSGLTICGQVRTGLTRS